MDDAPDPLTARGRPKSARRSQREALPEVTQVTPVAPVRAAPPDFDDDGSGDRRRLLWRDSATILIAVVIALLAIQAFGQRDAGVPVSTAIPSGVTTGSLPPGFSLPPGVTFGPIIDPSIGIDATPTPIPAVSESPRPSDAPTPSPSAKPSVKPSAKPSVKPSVKPSTAPSLPPTPPATPAVTPPPTANFDCMPNAGNQLSCSDLSSGLVDTWTWAWGDGNQDTGSNPPTHTYDVLYTLVTVRLTVSGPGGSDFVEKQFLLIP